MFKDRTRHHAAKVIRPLAVELLISQLGVIRQDPTLTDFIRLHIRMLGLEFANDFAMVDVGVVELDAGASLASQPPREVFFVGVATGVRQLFV